MGRRSEPRPWRVRHSQWGARDAGANKISGEERLPVEWRRSVGEAGSFRISRPEEVIQRIRSFPSGLGGMSLSHVG